MDQQLIEKVMKQVSNELGIGKEECKAEAPKEECCGNIGLTEFVGTRYDRPCYCQRGSYVSGRNEVR